VIIDAESTAQVVACGESPVVFFRLVELSVGKSPGVFENAALLCGVCVDGTDLQ
jgi:hypothetical protein